MNLCPLRIEVAVHVAKDRSQTIPERFVGIVELNES